MDNMEPLGLALTKSPINLAAILLFLVAAALIFIAARGTKEDEEE